MGTNVPYKSQLSEIKDWMDANPEEIVILYLDAKPESVSLESQCRYHHLTWGQIIQGSHHTLTRTSSYT